MYVCVCLQLGSGQLGDLLRVLSGGKQAAHQVAYLNKYGSSAPPPPEPE